MATKNRAQQKDKRHLLGMAQWVPFLCLGVKLMGEKKKLSNAEKGVQAAIEKAQAGELISK